MRGCVKINVLMQQRNLCVRGKKHPLIAAGLHALRGEYTRTTKGKGRRKNAGRYSCGWYALAPAGIAELRSGLLQVTTPSSALIRAPFTWHRML